MPETRSSKDRVSKPKKANTKATPATTSTKTNNNSTFYFWRHTDPEKGWPSQWYECEFTDPNGIVYKTAEHYMMYHKAVLFNDPATAQLILESTTLTVWVANRERIVEDGTRYKYTRPVSEEGLRYGVNPDAELIAPMTLRGLLLATGDEEIVEASPMDKIWGIGFGERKAEANRERWGLNLLGKALVKVRGELREEEGKEKKEGV
ncbi:N-glycosidase R617 [Podospora aff. communis PSN243]|uniref:N-glycosidase R617 n=1 Tax=Podospora aff. communis PSN243 TaxID=3040156 RepID=A0AAV9GKH2_9PEZI|nr:N-glycosidase R617 [Podospora aff. communis PSN243]